MSSAAPDAAALLEASRRTRDDLAARLLLAASVERAAREAGVLTAVTGGTAVDFYAAGAAGTSSAYPRKWRPSGDVDLLALRVGSAPDAVSSLKRALVGRLGLRAEILGRDVDGREVWGRALDVPGSPFGFEIVGDEIGGDMRAERVFTVEVEGAEVTLVGPEDIVLLYAESGWDTWHARDWERALAVFSAMRSEIDLDYLRSRARERRMPGVVEEVLAGRPLPARRRRLF